METIAKIGLGIMIGLFLGLSVPHSNTQKPVESSWSICAVYYMRGWNDAIAASEQQIIDQDITPLPNLPSLIGN